MRPFMIRVLRLAACATVVAAPLATATGGEAKTRHLQKHHHQRTNLGSNNSLRRSWAAGEVRPVSPAWNGVGEVCPGLARGIDCKIFPPPIYDDPDRKQSGTDGGG